MSGPIRAPRDFWTGLIYVALGGAALYFGQAYKLGTAGRMGPGYFPQVLSGLLIVLGVLSLARSFLATSAPISALAWKPLLLVSLATALFGFLLPRAGVVIALAALCLVSAAASKDFRFEWKAAFGLVALITFCVLVFVKGLGVPMPIVGTWLQSFITSPWLR